VRYYEIIITDEDGKELQKYTSYPNDRTNPNALDIEFDIQVGAFGIPTDMMYVKIWGIPLSEIVGTSRYNPVPISGGTFKNKFIEIYAGMRQGLPLARYGIPGLIARGYIQQAFGNWIGTEMTLDIHFTSDAVQKKSPYIVFSWKKGTDLSEAIRKAIEPAYPKPKYKVDINITEKIVLTEDADAVFFSLTEFAMYIRNITIAFIRVSKKDWNYSGVKMAMLDNTIKVFDTSSSKPKDIEFFSLIGQPTWLSTNKISLTTVLRSDIQVGDIVKLPPGQYITTIESFPAARDTTVIQGTFQVMETRYAGRFRNPNAQAWISVYNCATWNYNSTPTK
jgi:hypothetical protein